MESAAKKLKNSRGASIILALVFLLVCVMVGSSVLMAASSNAGRSRSNRQEQQLYLFLSSALQLVEDDLTGAEYTCWVNYDRRTVENHLHHYFTYKAGELARPNSSKPLFADVFRPALDSISMASVKDVLEKQYPMRELDPSDPINDYYWHIGYDSAVKEPQSFTLTVTPKETGPLAKYEAQVDVTIDTNYRVTLTARMTGAPDTKALELFQNYSLTTTLTRSGGITSLTIPEGKDAIDKNNPVPLSAGDITWKAGQVVREYREEAGP